jgi:hypothetical protein
LRLKRKRKRNLRWMLSWRNPVLIKKLRSRQLNEEGRRLTVVLRRLRSKLYFQRR